MFEQISVNFCWIDAFDKGGLFTGGRKQSKLILYYYC